jgi:hypothetical protein
MGDRPEWDIDLVQVSLDNPLVLSSNASLLGATGELRMAFRPSSPYKFRISEVQENRRVAYETQLPGCLATWYWDFAPVPQQEREQVSLEMGVTLSGLASPLYGWLLGSALDKAFVFCTGNLKTLMETGVLPSKEEQMTAYKAMK